jgi:hypothetical protein
MLQAKTSTYPTTERYPRERDGRYTQRHFNVADTHRPIHTSNLFARQTIFQTLTGGSSSFTVSQTTLSSIRWYPCRNLFPIPRKPFQSTSGPRRSHRSHLCPQISAKYLRLAYLSHNLLHVWQARRCWNRPPQQMPLRIGRVRNSDIGTGSGARPLSS